MEAIKKISSVNALIAILILISASMLFGEFSIYKMLSNLNGKVRYYAMVDDFLVYNQGPQIGTIMPDFELVNNNNQEILKIGNNSNEVTMLFVSPNCAKCSKIVGELNNIDKVDNLVLVDTSETNSINSNKFLSSYTKRMKNLFMVHSTPYMIKMKGNVIIDKNRVDLTSDVLTFVRGE